MPRKARFSRPHGRAKRNDTSLARTAASHANALRRRRRFLEKTEILFTHVSCRAPARVVAGIDAGKQSSRAGEAGASERSSGYSSRESFSLLSEAATSRFVGG